MAGERLYSEFKDDKGDVWRVSIYDTNSLWNAANATSFKLGGEGFVISYSGANEMAHQPIIGSSVEFTMYEQVAAHTNTLNLLYSHDEGRLLLEVYRDPDGDNSLYWRGVILAEQVERNDESFPTPIRLTASDDIGNLKDTEFTRSLGSVTGTAVVKDILRCLSAVRTNNLYSAGDPLIRYINDTELYAASDDADPLATIAASVPLKMADDGTSENYSCYDILHSFATCFNARVFQAEGVWWFWPINTHQRVADGTAISTLVKQYDKDGTAVTWTAADILAMNGAYKQTSGTDYNKLAGHVFTHLPPVESVVRSRRTNGNMYIVSGDDNTIVTTGTNISLADDDRSYDTGTKFQVNGQVLFNVSGDAAFDFGLDESRVDVELEIMLNVDSKYYQPEEWTTDSADRYVIDLAGFDRSNGCNINTMFSFITDALPSDEDGLDVTAVIKFFDWTGANVTSSYTSEDFYIFLAVTYVDGDTGNADLIRFRSEGNSDNVLVIDQGEILHGDRNGFSSQGNMTNGTAEWKSSQTAGPLSVHRLGVNEALARQRYATKIHRGTVYGLIEMWQTMVEDSEYYVPFQLSTTMNRRETTVERYKIGYDSSGITNADDEVRREVNRGNMVDFVNATANTITSQVQQPKLTAGITPVAPNGGRAIQQENVQGPVRHRVTELSFTSGSTEIIAADGHDYMYTLDYTDTANGFGSIRLPKVADSEGRVFRFKTDDSIGANKYIKIGPNGDDYTNGTRIDGEADFAMDRDYDGISVICHDSQWFVIQRKGKTTGGGGADEINDLSDVNVTSPTTGSMLRWDGTNWVDTQDIITATSGSVGDSVIIKDAENANNSVPLTLDSDSSNGRIWLNFENSYGAGQTGQWRLVGAEARDVVLRTDFATANVRLAPGSGGNVVIESSFGNTAYELPNADGSNGQIMQTNGSGSVSFADMPRKFLQVYNLNFVDDLATSLHYMPFSTQNEQTTVYQEEAAQLMPYDGRIRSVSVRVSSVTGTSGNMTIGIRTIPSGSNQFAPIWTLEETETMAWTSTDDYHTFHFVFSNAQHFEAGDMLTLSIQNSADMGSTTYFYVTTVVEYDTVQDLGTTSTEHGSNP